MVERVLDWRPKHDPRSLNFPAREVVGSPRLRDKMWRLPRTLDQGREGACVGFGCTHELGCSPVVVDFARVKKSPTTDPTEFAQYVYKRAREVDEFPGEEDNGTSVNAGLKVLRELGLLGEYRWCFGINDVRDSILAKGPVILGTNWYSGMYNAPNGILNVSGNLVGGHCYLAVGYSMAGKVFDNEPGYAVLNSWGADWGRGGVAFIRESHLSSLLRRNGEAALITKRSYGR